MSDSRDGGSAFPVMLRVDDIAMAQEEGMTLRDYFAAKAMQGNMANHNYVVTEWQNAAEDAYSMADAMIAERNRKAEQ